jgi:hypothetical protein
MAEPKNPNNPKDQRQSSAKQELQESELVVKLVPDPSQQQPVVVLSGFLGRSPEAGHWRLYLTAALNEYVEMPEVSIVHSQSLKPNQSSLGVITVWVRSDTPLRYTRITSRQIQAEFLHGSIMSRVIPTAVGLPPAVLSYFKNFRGRQFSVNFCPSDVGSTCEDVCTATRQLCGQTIDCTGDCSGIICFD